MNGFGHTDMALTLLLLRHAKSSWDDPELADHDRPLSNRGRSAAKTMAGYLADEHLKPDVLLCSTAERTRRTLDAILNIWPGLNVHYEDSLYLATTGQALNVLNKSGAGSRTLLIGHNPTIEDLAHKLQDHGIRGNSRAAADLSAKFPTAALAILSLDCSDWSDVQPGCGHLTHFVKPRDLEKS